MHSSSLLRVRVFFLCTPFSLPWGLFATFSRTPTILQQCPLYFIGGFLIFYAAYFPTALPQELVRINTMLNARCKALQDKVGNFTLKGMPRFD